MIVMVLCTRWLLAADHCANHLGNDGLARELLARLTNRYRLQRDMFFPLFTTIFPTGMMIFLPDNINTSMRIIPFDLPIENNLDFVVWTIVVVKR